MESTATKSRLAWPQQLRKVTMDGPPSQYVRLNVGGCFFSTTIGTLTSKDTMFRAMFSGKMEVLTDNEDWILIDRSGKHFATILNFLRDGHVPLPATQNEIEELVREAKYYLCQDLVQQCELNLQANVSGVEAEPLCQVPYVTNPLEEQMLLLNSKKPVVKLQINRHNNKYSYTSASEENLLKSLELFDKLALKFSKRILFMKDVISTSEICCWVFFGNNKKIAEVCCTSIVYTSDKGKHTKVEFPESRVLEETLNVLLYERPSQCPLGLLPTAALSPSSEASPSTNGTPNAAIPNSGSTASMQQILPAAAIAALRVSPFRQQNAAAEVAAEQQPDVVGSSSSSSSLAATTSNNHQSSNNNNTPPRSGGGGTTTMTSSSSSSSRSYAPATDAANGTRGTNSSGRTTSKHG